MDIAQVTKILKESMKSGKYTLGAKECAAGMKGAKALLVTKSVPATMGAKLREAAESHHVQVVELPVSSAELARMVGRPYNVSAMTLKTVSEADLKQFK